MALYGFTIKSKSEAMPKNAIKYFSCSCPDDAKASDLASSVVSCLANNAKIGIRKIITAPKEADFELQDGSAFAEEALVQLRLNAEYDFEGKTYVSTATVKMPCVDATKLDNLVNAFSAPGVVQLAGADNLAHNVTSVQLNYVRAYSV